MLPLLLAFAAALSPVALQEPGTPETPAHELAAALAEDLSQGQNAAFLAHFDEKMPGYDRLRGYIAALDSQGTGCSIEIRDDQGDSSRRKLALDWILELSDRRRRGIVRVTIERQGKRWKITALDPVEFFAPPRS
ncbi:MAG TPA: hypothetical protein VHA11_08510 [Bryobacteraceae bacterium]|nr:hypothetical protein [Bryobacteraceae bacterium]